MQIDWIGSNVIFDVLSEANQILFISFVLGIAREGCAAHISKSQQLKLCVYLEITVLYSLWYIHLFKLTEDWSQQWIDASIT